MEKKSLTEEKKNLFSIAKYVTMYIRERYEVWRRRESGCNIIFGVLMNYFFKQKEKKINRKKKSTKTGGT